MFFDCSSLASLDLSALDTSNVTDMSAMFSGCRGLTSLDLSTLDTRFLFCGKRTNRIKALLWEGDGFVLMYKRLDVGGFDWSRTTNEALEITPEQYSHLMKGFSIVAKKPINKLDTPPKAM